MHTLSKMQILQDTDDCMYTNRTELKRGILKRKLGGEPNEKTPSKIRKERSLIKYSGAI